MLETWKTLTKKLKTAINYMKRKIQGDIKKKLSPVVFWWSGLYIGGSSLFGSMMVPLNPPKKR